MTDGEMMVLFLLCIAKAFTTIPTAVEFAVFEGVALYQLEHEEERCLLFAFEAQYRLN